MRHAHTHSQFRLAIIALEKPDGYVEALLGLGKNRANPRRRAIVLGRRSRRGCDTRSRTGS
jgi:hypothetical protein